jgi:hypothetical protein
MGGSRYDDAIYSSRIDKAAATGADLFVHDDAIRSGKIAAGVHKTLDPKLPNTVGKFIRESLDSDAAPNSRAIAVLFDVTGSMQLVPRLFSKKLEKLMSSLVKKGFVPDPHIMFGGIGDATCDKAPLQLGQFEGGNEIDDTLTNIFLEGGGGGRSEESYDLALYYIARKTDCDCIKKRGQKGYLFILGDERLYPAVRASQVKEFIGDTLEKDIPIDEMVAEVKKNWNLFFVMPGGTSYWGNDSVIGPNRKMFGQNFILLENPDDVCELIVSTIGVTEGYDLHDVGAALTAVGADAGAISRSSTALTAYAKSAGLTKTATVSAPLVEAGTDDVSRLG